MPYISPEWLELEKQSGGRFVMSGNPQELKAQWDGVVEMMGPLMPPPSPNVETKDGDVDGIRYRIYTPKAPASEGSLPVGMYFHAGGWTVGDLNADDPFCRAVAEHTPTILVSVEYRLGPDHKWPIQLQDCLTVYRWARQNTSSFGGDPEKMYTIGISAGGQLAFATASKLLSKPEFGGGVKGIVALVPNVFHPDNVPREHQSDYKSFTENAKDVPNLDAEVFRTFLGSAGFDPKDPEAFPGLATDKHKHFPPTYIAACGADPLRDDGLLMAKALEKVGVSVKSKLYEGLPHCFWLNPAFPPSQLFMVDTISGMRWVLENM